MLQTCWLQKNRSVFLKAQTVCFKIQVQKDYWLVRNSWGEFLVESLMVSFVKIRNHYSRNCNWSFHNCFEVLMVLKSNFLFCEFCRWSLRFSIHFWGGGVRKVSSVCSGIPLTRALRATVAQTTIPNKAKKHGECLKQGWSDLLGPQYMKTKNQKIPFESFWIRIVENMFKPSLTFCHETGIARCWLPRWPYNTSCLWHVWHPLRFRLSWRSKLNVRGPGQGLTQATSGRNFRCVAFERSGEIPG